MPSIILIDYIVTVVAIQLVAVFFICQAVERILHTTYVSVGFVKLVLNAVVDQLQARCMYISNPRLLQLPILAHDISRLNVIATCGVKTIRLTQSQIRYSALCLCYHCYWTDEV